MVVHNTVPGTAALLRTMLTKQSRGPLKQSLVVGIVTRVYENATYSLFNEYKSVYNSGYNCSRLVSDVLSRDCNLINILVHNTVPGTDAFL